VVCSLRSLIDTVPAAENLRIFASPVPAARAKVFWWRRLEIGPLNAVVDVVALIGEGEAVGLGTARLEELARKRRDRGGDGDGLGDGCSSTRTDRRRQRKTLSAEFHCLARYEPAVGVVLK